MFWWEQYGNWCFARHEDVNALLRDRRFGRQILHVATREELDWPETPAHLNHSTPSNNIRFSSLNRRFTHGCGGW